MRNDVRKLRVAAGFSQHQLGEALAVSRQTVNSIETGRYDPSLPLAIAIAQYFHVTVEDFSCGPGDVSTRQKAIAFVLFGCRGGARGLRHRGMADHASSGVGHYVRACLHSGR